MQRFLIIGILSLVISLSAQTQSIESKEDQIPSQDTIKALKRIELEWGWFIGAGVGGVFGSEYPTSTLNPIFGFFDFHSGFILTHSQKYSSILSLDLGYVPLSANHSNHSMKINLSGYTLDFTLNYNSSYTFIQYSGGYESAILAGIGIGGRYGTIQEQLLQLLNPSTVINSSTMMAFIINANLGWRNIIAENHAIDLMFKFNVFQVGSGENSSIGKFSGLSGFGSASFFIAYTFLKF